jgi:hypothetical protein
MAEPIDPGKHKTLGISKEEFVKDSPGKSFSERIWEITKDVEPLREADLPSLYYDLDGDLLCVVTRLHNSFHYAKWINHNLTMEYCMGDAIDDHVMPVGFQLWGFSRITDGALGQAYDFLVDHSLPVDAKLREMIAEERRTAAKRLSEHKQREKEQREKEE